MDQVAAPQIFERISFAGKIHLIHHDQQLTAISEQLNSVIELGFDTETRPSFKKGEVYKTSLLQLSTETDAYIIQLNQVSQISLIRPLFENEKIIKAGVAIRDDLKNLKKIFNFDPKGFVELQELAKVRGLKNFGLKGMTQEVLQSTISKSSKLTNWENKSLTEAQLKYAATDAWIGLKLYQKLK